MAENNFRADTKTGKISVISPTGQYGTIDPGDLNAALASGYKYEAPEERIARIEGAQYGGGIAAPVGAAALGAARTLTGGATDVAARALGVGADVRKIREYNPLSSLAGEIGAAIALPSGEGKAKGLIGRAAAMTPAGVGTRLAQTATQNMANRIVQAASREAIIGAGFGAGQAVSDLALSEADMTPESVATSLISNVGLGAITGGVAGAAFAKVLGAPKTAQKLIKTEDALEAAARPTLDIPVTGTIENIPGRTSQEIAEQLRPDSVDAIKALNSAYEGMGLGAGELPTAQRLNEVKSILGAEMKIKPLSVHEEMAASKKARDIYGTLLRDTPTADAEAFLRYEQNFKKQAELGIQDAITAGTTKETKPLFEAGDELLTSIKKAHTTEKKALGDIFENIGAKEIPAGAHNADLVVSLSKNIPFLGRAMRVTGSEAGEKAGQIALQPFSPKFGIDEANYGIIKKALETVNDPNVTIKDLQAVREFVRKSKDVTSLGSESLDQVRKTMLDHISKVTELYKPDAKIREAITRYAINENNLDKLERIIGGSVDNLNLLDKAVPENVIGKIFSNSNNMQAAREVLGEERFLDLTKNYVNSFVDKATDKVKGGFSSQKFHSEIQKKAVLLKQAMGDQRYNKLLAWTDAARLIPDAPPVNPSGTAKSGLIRSAYDVGKKAVNLQFGDAVGAIDDYLQAKSNLKLMGEVLKGQKTLQDIQRKQNIDIKSSIQEFFNKGRSAVGGKKDNAARALSKGALSISSIKEEHDKQIERIADLANNPESLASALGANTEKLAELDPNVQAQVVQRANAGIQYLNNIAPKNPGIQDAFAKDEYRASDAEYIKWARAFRVVNQPLTVLDDLKSGLLTPESVKALAAVYPDMHQKLQAAVLDQYAKSKPKLSFQQKEQLGLLVGPSVKSAFNPQFIQAMQKNYQSGEQQQQGGVKPTVGGMKQLNLAKGSETNLQRVLSR